MAAHRKQFLVVIDARSQIGGHYAQFLWYRPNPGRPDEASVFRCDRVDATNPHYLVLEGLDPGRSESPPQSFAALRLWIAHSHVLSIAEDSAGAPPRLGFV